MSQKSQDRHESPLVSVIIPVFNGETYLRRCIDSVLQQSMTDFELIVVDDGSTDSTASILREYEAEYGRVRVLRQSNGGQGQARNRAMSEARGQYILFVDADDFIERVTLQVVTERAEQDQADLVHFDWKFYIAEPVGPGQFKYSNTEPFWGQRVLRGPECDELLRVNNFYSVTKLYRRGLLLDNGIRFEERRIYEDNPFVVKAISCAETVSLVHSPLYNVNAHTESTTRKPVVTDIHAQEHLHAVRHTFEALGQRNPKAVGYLMDYQVRKFGAYYRARVPKISRPAYARGFVDILHCFTSREVPNTTMKPLTRIALTLNVFEKRRDVLFAVLVAVKNQVVPIRQKLVLALRQFRGRRSKNACKMGLLPGTVTFLGFDYRYTGNSRFLFEDLVSDPRFAAFDIRFVADDMRVPEPSRLEPDSAEAIRHLARSQLVIAETWVPGSVRKNPETVWVQLWHGTPVKRILFDSHEPHIFERRPHHKKIKYEDVQRWDYLVVDSPEAAKRFETAFLFEPTHFLKSGYPRVAALKRKGSVEEARLSVWKKLGIQPPGETKLVLYAPTWRDKNYGKQPGDRDASHELDLDAFVEGLEGDVIVGYRAHDYAGAVIVATSPRCVDVSKLELQDLVAAADIVISDYSSVVYDVQSVGGRLVLYAPDREQFELDRGIYEDAWQELERVHGRAAGRIEELTRRVSERLLAEDTYESGNSFSDQPMLAEMILAKLNGCSEGGEPRR